MNIIPNPEQNPEADYQDPSDLTLRQDIQDKFSTQPLTWHEWLFQHLTFPPQALILELGSGPGRFWQKNAHRLPSSWSVIVTDFSHNMVVEAGRELRSISPNFDYLVLDAQAIGFPDDQYDAVIADGVLDLLANLDQALGEIHRVLKPGGFLAATTAGKNHLSELVEWVRPFAGEIQYGRTSEQFTLENGLHRLSKVFRGAGIQTMKDKMVFAEVEPILAYARSEGNMDEVLSGDRLVRFRNFLENRLAAGEIHLTLEKGVFKAVKPL